MKPHECFQIYSQVLLINPVYLYEETHIIEVFRVDFSLHQDRIVQYRCELEGGRVLSVILIAQDF